MSRADCQCFTLSTHRTFNRLCLRLLLLAAVNHTRLMPGVLVLPLLQSNPSLLLSVQRGSSDLGPGAEFMGPG